MTLLARAMRGVGKAHIAVAPGLKGVENDMGVYLLTSSGGNIKPWPTSTGQPGSVFLSRNRIWPIVPLNPPRSFSAIRRRRQSSLRLALG